MSRGATTNELLNHDALGFLPHSGWESWWSGKQLDLPMTFAATDIKRSPLAREGCVWFLQFMHAVQWYNVVKVLYS